MECLLLPQHAEVARIVDGAQIMQLFHHEFLNGELADDTFLDATLSRHLANAEMDIQFMFILQACDAAIGIDREFFIQRGHADILKYQLLGIAAEVDSQRQGYREIRKHRGERSCNILQDDTSCDWRSGEFKRALQLFVWQLDGGTIKLQLSIGQFDVDIAKMNNTLSYQHLRHQRLEHQS